MKVRAEFRELRRMLAKFRVSTKVRLGALGRNQRHICERLDAMDTRLTGMENDLVIIKQCLVKQMRAEERDPGPDAPVRSGV